MATVTQDNIDFLDTLIQNTGSVQIIKGLESARQDLLRLQKVQVQLAKMARDCVDPEIYRVDSGERRT
jgi:hypothetical protein